MLLLASSPLQRTVRQNWRRVLAKFVHIFEQTILMEDWLGKEQFSIEEVENAKKIIHSTLTNLLKLSKERKEKDPN